MANLRAYGVIGTLAVGLPIALLTYTASHLPAGVLTPVLALSPPFTYGFGVLLRLDRLSWFGVLGILFGFAGVTVLVAPTASLPEPGASGWFMLSLLASVMFAGANVIAAVLRPPAEDSVAMASETLLGAAVVPLVLLVVIDHGGAFQGFSTNGWIALAGAAAMNSVVFVLYLEIVRTAGPTFFAQVNYIAIPAGIGWGELLFGERHSAYVWFALALMFVGMAMIARKGVGTICARDRSYFGRRHKTVFKPTESHVIGRHGSRAGLSSSSKSAWFRCIAARCVAQRRTHARPALRRFPSDADADADAGAATGDPFERETPLDCVG